MTANEGLQSPMERPAIKLVETWLEGAVGKKDAREVGQPREAAEILHDLTLHEQIGVVVDDVAQDHDVPISEVREARERG